MKFIKEKDFLKNRLKKIKRYNTLQEKEVLLLEEDNPVLYTKILNTPEPINELEALAFLIKAREISVSDIVEGFKECSECKVLNEFQIDLMYAINTDIEVPGYPDFPIGLFSEVEDIISKEDADELNLKEYNELEEIIIENNKKIFNPIGEFYCRIPTCNHKNEVAIDPIEILSKSTLTGIYEEMFNISFYTNNPVTSIEKMYPFERGVFISLLKKKIENPEN